MNRDNQEAVCAASALLSLSAVASTQTKYSVAAMQSREISPIDDWLEISVFIRGVQIISQSAHWPSVMTGILKPLLGHMSLNIPEDDPELQAERTLPEETMSVMNSLITAIQRCSSSDFDKIVLRWGIRHLKISLAINGANDDHEAAVMIWSNLLEDEFFPLVTNREPMALVLLAHATTMVTKHRSKWWVGELGLKMLDQIYGILASLDECDWDVMDSRAEDVSLPAVHLAEDHVPATGSAPVRPRLKWTDLLDWPLRQSGVYDLYHNSV
jgi:hypothetical protein